MIIVHFFMVGLGMLLWTMLGAKILIPIMGKPLPGTEFVMFLPCFFWPIALPLFLVLTALEKVMAWMCKP